MLRVGFVTSFHPFLFSALFYKNNRNTARTKSWTGPATDGEAASVSALTPPFRHLICRPIRRRNGILLSIAPFILQFMLEYGTESGDEVTLVERPMDRGHKIYFTMSVSTIYPAVSTVDGEAFIISHCQRRSARTPNICRSWYFVIAGWLLQAASASPVRRVDCVLTYLQLERSWMRVEGARILPRATTLTAATNECLLD